jgi:endonuclease G
MKLYITIFLFFVAFTGYSQIEIPQYQQSCKLMQKNNFSYCIDQNDYSTCWLAGKILAADFNNQVFLPPDVNFFPELAKTGSYLWANLEKQVQLWAIEYDSLYVITGKAIMSGDSVTEPVTLYYKAILKGCQGDAIAFIIDPVKDKGKLNEYAVTVDQLEELTKMDFFFKLNTDLQEIIESSFKQEFWPITFE